MSYAHLPAARNTEQRVLVAVLVGEVVWASMPGMKSARLLLTGQKILVGAAIETAASEAMKARTRVTMRSMAKAMRKTAEKLPHTKDKSHTTMPVLRLLEDQCRGLQLPASQPRNRNRLGHSLPRQSQRYLCKDGLPYLPLFGHC